MSVKGVCIIGAGASGLAAIKCCLDEDLVPVCFEKSYDIGGLWRYEEGTKIGATVYRTTVINTSKELMCFSDFPIPAEWPNFMHHTKVMEYYRLYAEKFDLLKHINFNTEVLSCRVSTEDESKWEVRTRNINSEEENLQVFDGLMVAVGHHAEPHFPLKEFKGVDNFRGKILHNQDYRDFRGYENKNVLIVGLGNSAIDIAVDLSWHAKQVYLSTRRGGWVFNRVGPKGVPIDFVSVTRYRDFLSKVIPAKWTRQFLETMLTNKFDHAHYGLKPDHGPFEQHPLVNDDLPNRILNGSIKIKSNICGFTANSARFEDDTEEEVDAVIFATGYKYSFPFLDDSVIKVQNNTECALYKYMWPPYLNIFNIALIGHVQALGAVNPVSEIQSRWATRVFKGLAKIPDKSEMMRDIEEKAAKMKARFYSSQRHTLEIDHVPYMDEVAGKIGAKPNLFKMFITDYKLAYKVFYEICSPYQFRLTGPGRWDRAREMILTQKSRMFYPLHTRPLPKRLLKKKSSFNLYRYFLVAVFVFVISFLWCKWCL